jgi:hypothetical protein
MSEVIHHHVAKVIVNDEVFTYLPDDNLPDVIMPAKHARIITVNGEIWDRKFMAFGLDENKIVKHWDANCNDGIWKRFNSNGEPT